MLLLQRDTVEIGFLENTRQSEIARVYAQDHPLEGHNRLTARLGRLFVSTPTSFQPTTCATEPRQSSGPVRPALPAWCGSPDHFERIHRRIEETSALPVILFNLALLAGPSTSNRLASTTSASLETLFIFDKGFQHLVRLTILLEADQRRVRPNRALAIRPISLAVDSTLSYAWTAMSYSRLFSKASAAAMNWPSV